MPASLLLIGLGAGAASALMYAAAALSGSAFGILLAQAAPLPILIAGIGWRHVAGLVAAAIGTLILTGAIGPQGGFFFAIIVAAPSWWLAYLAMLARPDEATGETQWYPVGRLVIWCAVIGAALVAAPVIFTGLEAYRSTLREFFTAGFEVAKTTGRGPQLPSDQDAGKLIEFFTLVMPLLGATMWTFLSLASLWIAARVCRTSGRLPRPWPALPRMELPRVAGYGLAAALLGSAAPGVVGFVAELLTATLVIAFTLLGLAVVHVTTLSSPARPLILFALYALLIVPGFSAFLALLGVAEQLIGIRRRFGPPPGGPPSAAANLP